MCEAGVSSERESLCAEDGIYLINFKGCSECGSLNRAMDSLKQVGKKVTEELDEDITKEIVRFDRKSINYNFFTLFVHFLSFLTFLLTGF